MKTQTLFELDATELAAAATTMPLAIAEQNGQWGLYAVTGLQPEQNLFLQNDNWIGNYTPHSAGNPHPDSARYETRLAKTREAVQALIDAKVLAPWPQLLKDQVGMQLPGLYCINEAKLAALPAADFLLLRHAQALGIAYGVNLALQQCHLLVRLANRAHGALADGGADADVTGSADALFGEGQDDTLRFDF